MAWSQILQLFFLSFTLVASTSAALYSRHPGWSLTACTTSLAVSTLTRCAALCSASGQCVSGSHVAGTGHCCLSDRYLYQDGASFALDVAAIYFQEQHDIPSDGQWLMVYRGVGGNGQTLYDSFLDVGTHHDDVSAACWSVARGTCPSNSRSRRLDFWDGGISQPQKVKYAMYKNSAEVASIVFNGTGSSLTSWFTSDRILSSTFSDIYPGQTFQPGLSVLGLVDSVTTRRFYVSQSHDGCGNDWGWMAVVERPSCSWETPISVPAFLYSPVTTARRWDDTDIHHADVMTVSIQL